MHQIRFAVIGISHGHIYSQVDALVTAGGEFVSFFAAEEYLCAEFAPRYPSAYRAREVAEILEDSSTALVVCAAIPCERAAIGIAVMRHGKDFMVDKPGITTLAQLAEVGRVQNETGRIYSICFSERLLHPATVRAAELVAEGAIGRVVQTVGLGPHRANVKHRPQWFFRRAQTGGILVDLASHQIDQFLWFTGASQAEVIAAQTANFRFTEYPELEDFGDVTLRGDGVMGYARVDWLSPDGLDTWGDGRLTVLGTEGYLEVRKNCDLAGRAGGNHLFLVDRSGTLYFDCAHHRCPYASQLIGDVLNRTETAMPQRHAFLVSQLALEAQQRAQAASSQYRIARL